VVTGAASKAVAADQLAAGCAAVTGLAVNPVAADHAAAGCAVVTGPVVILVSADQLPETNTSSGSSTRGRMSTATALVPCGSARARVPMV